MVVLYTSKTRGMESRPQRIRISAVQTVKDQKLFCPFKTVIKFMNTRGNYHLSKEPFFVFTDRSPVKPYHFRQMLRQLLDRLGLESNLYDVHSFRIGRTCDLAKFGYSIEQIKAMDRWKSNAVYRYLKN